MPSALKPLLSLLIATPLLLACSPGAESGPQPQHSVSPGHAAEQDQTLEVQPVLSATAEDFRRQCDARLAELDSAIGKLESAAPPFTVDSVLAPLNQIQITLLDSSARAGLFEAIHPDAAVRDVAGDCTSAFSDIATRIALSRPIYDAVAAVDVG